MVESRTRAPSVLYLRAVGATEISSPINALTLFKDTISYLSYTYNDVTVRANTSSSLTDTRKEWGNSGFEGIGPHNPRSSDYVKSSLGQFIVEGGRSLYLFHKSMERGKMKEKS
jgi:hypothetical protein